MTRCQSLRFELEKIAYQCEHERSMIKREDISVYSMIKKSFNLRRPKERTVLVSKFRTGKMSDSDPDHTEQDRQTSPMSFQEKTEE
jgi:hypothetical protein